MKAPEIHLPVQMLGLPTDRNSSFMKGASRAPEVVRKIMASGMSNLTAENGCDLDDPAVLKDLGSLELHEDDGDFEKIRETAMKLFSKGTALFIGGDHFVTWPILEGFTAATRLKPHLVQIDAHPDFYPEFDGSPTSHASTMARVMERNLAGSLTQIGLRTINKIQQKQIEKHGVTVFPASTGIPDKRELPSGITYLTIDLDGLDPAFAPGVSHHEPGGLTTREVIRLIWSLPGPLVGGDIVEYNPANDIHGMTAAVVMKLVKEMVARIVSDQKKFTEG